MAANTVQAVAGAAAGTSPAISYGTTSTDKTGSVTVTCGSSGVTTGVLLTLTLWGWAGYTEAVPLNVLWRPASPAMWALVAAGAVTEVQGQSANSSNPTAALQISTTTAPTASGVYTIQYTVSPAA